MLMCFVQSQTLEGGFGKKSLKGGLKMSEHWEGPFPSEGWPLNCEKAIGPVFPRARPVLSCLGEAGPWGSVEHTGESVKANGEKT